METRRLWMHDSTAWRTPRRWQPLTRFAAPHDRELRKIQNQPGDNQNDHDNHVQETLKETGSATALLIDPSDEGIRQAEIEMPALGPRS